MVSIATQLRASRTVVLARPWARHPAPAGAQLPLGDVAFMCQSQHGCGHRGRRVAAAKSRCGVSYNKSAWAAAMSLTKPSARSARRRCVGGFGESRRFFGTSRGNPVVLAPGIGRKIAAHTAGKAASHIRGISKGRTPWITFASFS